MEVGKEQETSTIFIFISNFKCMFKIRPNTPAVGGVYCPRLTLRDPITKALEKRIILKVFQTTFVFEIVDGGFPGLSAYGY
jgi:hypothetical protein